tara:strand:+ start:1443 stop:1922 length:480 start_codon:yes stop_codon:yes gene_type:complete
LIHPKNQHKNTPKTSKKTQAKQTQNKAKKHAKTGQILASSRGSVRKQDELRKNSALNPSTWDYMPPKKAYFIDGRRLYRRREFMRKNGVLWLFYGIRTVMLFFIVLNFANAARSTSAAGLYMHKKNPARTGSFLLFFKRVFFVYVPKQRRKIGNVEKPF